MLKPFQVPKTGFRYIPTQLAFLAWLKISVGFLWMYKILLKILYLSTIL